MPGCHTRLIRKPDTATGWCLPNEKLGQQNETNALVGRQRIFATVVPLT